MTATIVDTAAVQHAVACVVDPCSRLHGTDLSLVDLGMVESVRVDGTAVSIELLLDDPLCVYTFAIQSELREAVGAVHGVTTVDISMVANASWSRDRVSPAAQHRLLDVRTLRQLLVTIPSPRACASGERQ
jgi:metal-sulfur cluster biosynthetic enzyme